MWVIKTLNEDNYVKMNGRGKYTLTTNRMDARRFSSQFEAENYIKNTIPKKSRDNFCAEKCSATNSPAVLSSMPMDQLEDIAQKLREAHCDSEKSSMDSISIDEVSEDITALMNEISEDIQKLEESPSTEIYEKDQHPEELNLDSLEFDYAAYFKTFGELIAKMPDHYRNCKDRLYKIELAITDLKHYIEFHDEGVVGGYKIYKYFQDILKLRRKLKQEITYAEIVMKDIVKNHNTVGNILRYDDCNHNRTYCPRVLNNLFRKGIRTLEEEDKESL